MKELLLNILLIVMCLMYVVFMIAVFELFFYNKCYIEEIINPNSYVCQQLKYY